MAKTRDRPAYRCAECGHTPPSWVGRCPECQAWGSVAEVGAAPVALRPLTAAVAPGRSPRRRGRSPRSTSRRPGPGRPGCGELDRVLGGGLVPGRGGAAGRRAGRRQVHPAAGRGRGTGAAGAGTALVVTGEESAAQVRLRAERIGALHRPALPGRRDRPGRACSATSTTVKPGLLVVDSVQTIAVAGGRRARRRGHPGAGGRGRADRAWPRSAAWPRCWSATSPRTARSPGPRVLEHLVDVVLHFEGDRHSPLRLVRAIEEPVRPGRRGRLLRAAPTAASTGLPDPSGLFLTRRDRAGAGHLRDGHPGGPPAAAGRGAGAGRRARRWPPRGGRRRGLDSARVAMVLAVLERRGRVRLGSRRRLRRHRRRGPADRAGRRPGAGARGGLGAPATRRSRRRPGRDRRGRAGRRGAPGRRGVGRRLAEAARLGFTAALVPPRPRARLPGRHAGHRGRRPRRGAAGAAAREPLGDRPSPAADRGDRARRRTEPRHAIGHSSARPDVP